MFIATQGLFMYNNKLYKQIEGVTIRSPLGPTLAIFFLRCLEEKLFENCDVVPKLYLRYIDDIYTPCLTIKGLLKGSRYFELAA